MRPDATHPVAHEQAGPPVAVVLREARPVRVTRYVASGRMRRLA